jgi:hypothetical protein
MKKLGVVLAILAVVALVGCGSGTAGGAAKGDGGGAAPFKVDLSKLSMVVPEKPKKIEDVLKGQYKTVPGVKNTVAFTQNYDDLLILLTASDIPADFSKYTRCTITVKYYNPKGDEIKQADGFAMAVLVYDIKGDLRGPAMDAGPNTPLKQMNLGGYSGMASTDRGARVSLSKPPQAILLQNANAGVAFLELTSLVFHNGDYKSE